MKTEELVAKLVQEELAKREAEAEQMAKKMRERWTAHFDEREKQVQSLIGEAKARGAALDQIMEKERPPKEWDWKRSTWAAVSGACGGVTAYLLHSRCPALNQAAGGMTGALLAEELGFKGHIPAFGMAVGSIFTIWSTDNIPLASMGMASVAYGKVVFDLGEDAREAFVKFKAEREEAKAKASKSPKKS